MKSLTPTRLEYIDGLKIIMILCVLFCHLPEYLKIEFNHFYPEFGGVGVSGFIILSGFGLTYSHLTKNATDVKVIPFFWKRFTRLIPLYYVALFTYLLIVDLMEPSNLLAHLFVVHTFFKDFSHTPGSLWFIGLIVQCYLFFPLAYKLINQKRGLFLLNLSAIFIYILAIILAVQGFYVSDSFLSFVIEFVLGINLAVNIYRRKTKQYLALTVFTLTVIELACFILLIKTSLLYELPYYLHYPITTFSRICFFIFTLNVLVFIQNNYHNFDKLVPLLSAMSLASYAVYLFHRPILTIIVRGSTWNWIVAHTFSDSIKFISLSLVSIPLIFLISYWIQIAHDSMQKKFFFKQ